jgi:hypothetical protein
MQSSCMRLGGGLLCSCPRLYHAAELADTASQLLNLWHLILICPSACDPTRCFQEPTSFKRSSGQQQGRSGGDSMHSISHTAMAAAATPPPYATTAAGSLGGYGPPGAMGPPLQHQAPPPFYVGSPPGGYGMAVYPQGGPPPPTSAGYSAATYYAQVGGTNRAAGASDVLCCPGCCTALHCLSGTRWNPVVCFLRPSQTLTDAPSPAIFSPIPHQRFPPLTLCPHIDPRCSQGSRCCPASTLATPPCRCLTKSHTTASPTSRATPLSRRPTAPMASRRQQVCTLFSLLFPSRSLRPLWRQ